MKALALILASLCAATALHADSAGTAGADFLKIPVSARAAGMGGALSALSDDLSALEVNPARLSQLDGVMATGGHLSYFEGIAMENLSLGYGWNGAGLAFGFQSLSSPEIAGLDSQGRDAASFSLHDMALTLGYGQRLGALSAGLDARMVTRSLAGLNSTGYMGDIGLGLELGKGFSLALLAQNLGSASALESVADPLPLSYRGGLGFQGEPFSDSILRIEADAVLPSDSSLQLRGGLELEYQQAFFVRAGGQWSEAFDSRQNFSAGAGFRLSQFQLDYSYVPFSALGSAQRLSLSVYLSRLLHPGAATQKTSLSRPLNLKIKPSPEGLDLSWEAPTQGEVDSYAVYVRRGADAELKRITLKPLRRRLVHIKGAFGDKEYGVAVSALDMSGKEGERSREVKIRPDSKTREVLGAPEPPHKLSARKEKGHIHLSWQAAESPGRLRYQIYASTRSHNSYMPVKNGEIEATQFDFVPAGMKSGSAFFVVKTLRSDKGGTAESEFSEEVPVPLK